MPVLISWRHDLVSISPTDVILSKNLKCEFRSERFTGTHQTTPKKCHSCTEMAFNCSLQTCSSSRVPCEPASEQQICSHVSHFPSSVSLLGLCWERRVTRFSRLWFEGWAQARVEQCLDYDYFLALSQLTLIIDGSFRNSACARSVSPERRLQAGGMLKSVGAEAPVACWCLHTGKPDLVGCVVAV